MGMILQVTSKSYQIPQFNITCCLCKLCFLLLLFSCLNCEDLEFASLRRYFSMKTIGVQFKFGSRGLRKDFC